jgi:hypothetical protein
MVRYSLSHTAWRVSSYSGQDGNCVEVAAIGDATAWSASTSNGRNGACVEVARNQPSIVAVRDSKDRAGPALTFTPGQWQAFTAWIKADHPGVA